MCGACIKAMRESLHDDRFALSRMLVQRVRYERVRAWKIGFIYVEKLSKRCCIKFRLLYKYDIGCCSFAEPPQASLATYCEEDMMSKSRRVQRRIFSIGC